MIIYTVYKCINVINGKVYIGFDSNWPERKRKHFCNHKKINSKFYNSIRKHGWDNFVWDVIYQSKDRDNTLKVMEPYFIKKYDSYKNGLNSTLGGEGVFGLCRKQSEEEKRKRSISIKNTYKNNPKLGLAISFKFKGKPLSESRKADLRKPRTHKVKPLTEEHKNNISKSLLGKPKQKIECPHCKKIGGSSQMKQWHFDNCKFN